MILNLSVLFLSAAFILMNISFWKFQDEIISLLEKNKEVLVILNQRISILEEKNHKEQN